MNDPGFSAPGGGFPRTVTQPSPTDYVEGAQELIDNEHLRLLRIGYFISAGQTALMIPIGLIYAGMGAMMASFPMPKPSASVAGPPIELFTWLFSLIGILFAGFATAAAVLKLLAAIRLKTRRSRVLCLIAAGLACFEIPYGTVLGIWTFMVLGRASVRQQFDANGG